MTSVFSKGDLIAEIIGEKFYSYIVVEVVHPGKLFYCYSIDLEGFFFIVYRPSRYFLMARDFNSQIKPDKDLFFLGEELTTLLEKLFKNTK